MASETNIEWCDSSWNPWLGCTKVSPGCDHCYAERSTPARVQGIKWGPGQPRIRTSPANWKQPIAWNNSAISFQMEHGRRRRVFCASLADVFDNEVHDNWRYDLFELIQATPDLDWLILTKRIGNVVPMLERAFDTNARYSREPVVNRATPWRAWPWPNVWLGISVVNQEEAERDIPKLDRTPAALRWLSMEPLLGPVDIGWERIWGTGGGNGLDWVVAGGESGPGARPMHPDWARNIRDDCKEAGVPFLFKQWGEWTPGENVERVRGTVDTAFLCDDTWRIHPLNLATDHGHIDDQPDLYRVGKKTAGRLLDGAEHNGFPA